MEQLGYGWEGCITTAPPVVAYDHDYGEPVGQCKVSKVAVTMRFPLIVKNRSIFIGNLRLFGSSFTE
jgi:hypothetical protein